MNSTDKELNTEERILAVATEIFTKKGFDATSTRDIANAAGINVASLHYYYRSKEKLFQIVIGEKMEEFSKLMDIILDGDKPLYEKIRRFVPAEIDFMKKNPHLALFIFTETNRNVEHIDRLMGHNKYLNKLEDQLNDLAERGIIRPISIANFISNLIGMVIFPFLSKPMLKLKTGLEEQDFQKMLEERKTMIPEIVINYLYFDPPKLS